MVESVSKLLWLLISGAFLLGTWTGTHEFRLQALKEAQASTDVSISQIQSQFQAAVNQRDLDNARVIDFMGRVDERLKNIERKFNEND